MNMALNPSVFIVMMNLIPASIILNILVVVVLIRDKKLQVRHALLISLAMTDICAGTIGFPLETFTFSESTCLVAGYLVTFFSLVSISHLVGLAIERLISISMPFQSSSMFQKKRYATMFVGLCWSYGALWATLPWFGWGRYAYESKTAHRCSIDILSQNKTYISYNYALLFFCYVIPIFVMLISFVFIKREMGKMLHKIKNSTGKNSKSTNATVKQERTFTLVVAVMLMSFLLAWTPYAVCVFLVSTNIDVSPVMLNVSAYLGKSSCVHNPIIYVFLYKHFRKQLLKVFLCCFCISSNSVMPHSNTKVSSQVKEQNVSVIDSRVTRL